MTEIVLSISNYRKEKGSPGYSLAELESRRKTLERYAGGKNINNAQMKSDLWSMYVEYGNLIDDAAPDEITSFILSSDKFFRHSTKQTDINALIGSYYGYKRSIREPLKLAIRFYVSISASNASDGILQMKEIHLNRTFKPDIDDPISEFWSGIIMKRGQGSYFAIVRDDYLGTPHAYTIHSEQVRDGTGQLVQLFGESIESVERWGKQRTHSSPVIFEKENKGLSRDEMLQECDLIYKRDLDNKRKDISAYIFREGGIHE